MAEVIVMPALGNSVESSLITEWLVNVGDEVEENTLVCAIETDKSSMEVPAGVAGSVLALLVEEGDDVPVKDPILVIGAPGETVDPALLAGSEPEEETVAPKAEPTKPQAAPPAPSAAATPALPTSSEPSNAVSPRARNLAASQGISAQALAGTGPKGRVIERDVQAAMAAGPGLTRGARAQAGDFVPGAAGSGIGGRVTAADLGTTTADVAVSVAALDFPGAFNDQPLKGVRKVIADRMMSSLDNAAQLTLNATANADGLLALRARLKSAPEKLGFNKVTIGDLVGYATVKTLANHLELNAHLENDVLRIFESVHLAVAVDTPRGLLVPAVRFADQMNLRQFSAASKEVAMAAIEGSISPDLLSGGTITVTNLGSFGIESFTPILNEPQTSILGVGTITPRPKTNADGSIGIENRIWLSLTMDHRAYDGADGARFLKDLTEAIENIDLIAMG